MKRVRLTALGRGAVAGFLVLSILSCGDDDSPTASGPPSGFFGLPVPGSAPSNLLRCVSDETEFGVAIIGPLGGLLTVDGSSISIPGGAVDDPTLFALTVPRSQLMEIRVSADWLQSFLFNQPVSITIDYSRCDDSVIEGKTLTVWQITPFTRQFIEHMGGTDDRAARKITFETGHLSTYAIAF